MKDLQTVLDALEQWTDETPRCDLGALDAKIYEAIAIVEQMMQAEPVAWIVFDEYGIPVHSTVHPKMAQDHINDALQEHDIQEAAKWVVRPVYAAPQAVPDPMTLMTDASIMQVAQGWREFDAPDGSGPVDSMVYGACRAALNKYRDLLLEAK